MNTNYYGHVGLEFLEALESTLTEWKNAVWYKYDKVFDLSPLLPVLKHSQIKDGCVLEAIPPEHDGMSLPYARYKGLETLNKKAFPGITEISELPDIYFSVEDAFEVDESPEGVWDAFLLWEMHRHLPCIQHGVYGTRELIFDLDTYVKTAALGEYVDEDLGVILEHNVQEHVKKYEGKTGYHEVYGYQTEEDLRVALSLIDCRILLPSINVNQKRLYISGWTPWSGLHRETLKYKRVNKSYGFLSLNYEKLANYWWGIMI